jgi:hypothetical protein
MGRLADLKARLTEWEGELMIKLHFGADFEVHCTAEYCTSKTGLPMTLSNLN